ncbi:MAG: DUF2752 domain-containing protein [Clostridia bacterium]|nr:DUF2752 domain-containing protein [Clostridia bacterium]
MNKKLKKMIFIELGIVFLVLIIYIAIKTGIVSFVPRCIINKNFGILCPSCGGTRCVINFVGGNFVDSFNYHPIFFITIFYLIIVNVIFIINSFRKKEVSTFLYPKSKFWIGFIIILFIFTILRNVFVM